ncbi:MAG: PspC domain-containing protein [Polymorphobacter sp.]
MNDLSKSFALDKANGRFLGVCAGIARFTGWDVTWIRVATAVLILAGFGSTLLVYLVIAWLAPNA